MVKFHIFGRCDGVTRGDTPWNSSAHVFFTIILKEPFPDAIMERATNYGYTRWSIHASSIVSNSDEEKKDLLKQWFDRAIVMTVPFELPIPDVDDRQATSSRSFLDYKASIEALALGLGVFDIRRDKFDSASIILEDSNGTQRKLRVRVDFAIALTSEARCILASIHYAKCVVMLQNEDNEEDSEYKLITCLFAMLNNLGMRTVAGILVYNNGTCRAYRAVRNGTTYGGMLEQNDTFLLYQIAEVLPTLLSAKHISEHY